MGEVLRKKISMSTGVPPSVSGAHRFWDQFEAAVSSWAVDAFRSKVAKVRFASEVIAWDAAKRSLSSRVAFNFSRDASPGLIAIGFEESSALAICSQRLGQPNEPFECGSSLLLRLLCEQPAFQLWRRLANQLPGHDVPDAASLLVEPAPESASDDPLRRFLAAAVELEAGEEAHRLIFVFELSFLLGHVRGLEREAAQRSSLASLANRESLGIGVRASSIVLDSVLERLALTIGECWRLQVGQVIPLPGVSTSDLALSAETSDGAMDIARGELGVWKGRRAVKLNSSIEQGFAKEIEEL